MKDIEKALLVIRDRKKAAEKTYDERLERLLADEEFDSLYSEVSYLRFELARRNVFELEIPEAMAAEFDEKSKRLARALELGGIDPLNKPTYYCKKCNDTGYVDGKKCSCLEKTRIDIALDEYKPLKNLPDSLNEIDFSFYGNDSEEYRKRARFLDVNFLNGSLDFCTIIGAPGTGKTFLAETLMKQALILGNSVKIINAIRLNREFLEYHCARIEDKSDIWSDIADSDWLLIDDLGVESLINNVTVQYLYELISEREGKKTLFTANLSVAQLEDKYGQRIFSRLSQKNRAAVISVTGRDYRI